MVASVNSIMKGIVLDQLYMESVMRNNFCYDLVLCKYNLIEKISCAHELIKLNEM